MLVFYSYWVSSHDKFKVLSLPRRDRNQFRSWHHDANYVAVSLLELGEVQAQKRVQP